jgi:putative membrane protein
MDGRRLLLAGLFNFSLFYLAAIFGAAFQYFDQLIEPILGDPDRWLLPSREQAARYGVYVTLAAGLAIVLLSIVTGLLRTIARDYRFRLSLAPNGFRRRRGLLTLSEVLIPIARVQVAILETGIVRKPLGWWSLDLQTLSADAHQSGQQDAAPFARIEEILPILERAGIDQLPPEDSYLRVSRRSVLRRYLAGAAPLALASLFAALLAPVALLLLVPILLGSILVIPLWRRHRYSLGEHSLFVREGLFRPRLWIMPYHRMQSVSVRRGPLQRRLRLATLEVDTAGASAFRSLSLRDLEGKVADALAVHLAEQYRAARAERLHQAR